MQLLAQAAGYGVIYLLIETILLLVFLALGYAAIGVPTALRLAAYSLAPAALLLAIPFWLMPIPALLGQWTVLVAGSADTTRLAFENIRAAFESHAAPVDLLHVQSLFPPGEPPRDYLELRRGVFRGYLSCFPHGRDLYAGWTFWLYMSPARLLAMMTGRAIRSAAGRADDVHQALWSESARALAASMHSAVLAGTGSAPGDLDPDGPPGPADAGDTRLRLG